MLDNQGTARALDGVGELVLDQRTTTEMPTVEFNEYGVCTLSDSDDPRALEELYRRYDGRIVCDYTSFGNMGMGAYTFLTVVEDGSPPFILERTTYSGSYETVARFTDSGTALKAFEDLDWVCKRLRPS